MKTISIIIATDEDGYEAIYRNGRKVYESDTVYACKVAEACLGQPCTVRHVCVEPIPIGRRFPDLFTELKKADSNSIDKSQLLKIFYPGGIKSDNHRAKATSFDDGETHNLRPPRIFRVLERCDKSKRKPTK